VIAKNPAVAVIETGVNSLANNMEPAAIFAYVQQSILDCQAANILPIVILVTPAYGHLTSTQNLKADTLNNLIIAYKQTNPNFVITDPRASLGTYNSSTGWTLRHEYSCDAGPTAYVHLNEAGHRILAQSIYKAYTNYLIPVPTTGVSFGGTTLGVWQENKIHYSVPSDETCLLSGNVNAQISSRAPTFPRSFECYTYSYTEIDALGAKIGTFDTLVINGEIYPDCYIYSFGNIHEIVYGSGKYTYSISFGHADSHA
jgi:hypothetical protein